MTSDQLSRLRSAPVERQKAFYKKYKAAFAKIWQNPYFDDMQSRYELARLQAIAAEELSSLLQSAIEDREKIAGRATTRKVAATPEARAKVERALANGFSGMAFHDLCRLLVEEKDRAALSALIEVLPYAHKAGQLPQFGDAHSDQLAAAREYISHYESALWSEDEQREAHEAREIAACFGMLAANHKELSTWLERQTVGKGIAEMVPGNGRLFPWPGLPGSALPTSGIVLDEETDQPRQRGIWRNT